MTKILASLSRTKQFLQSKTRVLALAVIALIAVGVADAQTRPAEGPAGPSRHGPAGLGPIEFVIEDGWAFKLPVTQTWGWIPLGGGLYGNSFTALTKNNSRAPSAGVRFWFTRWLGASADMVGINAGSDSTEVSNSPSLTPLKVSASQYFVGAFFGGELQRPRGSVRPYGHFGLGPLHRSSTRSSNVVVPSGETVTDSSTEFALRTGGGVRFMCSPRWGVKVGGEVLHYGPHFDAHTIRRVTVGFFFQKRARPAL